MLFHLKHLTGSDFVTTMMLCKIY